MPTGPIIQKAEALAAYDGNASAVARALDIRPAAVHQWKDSGPIPQTQAYVLFYELQPFYPWSFGKPWFAELIETAEAFVETARASREAIMMENFNDVSHLRYTEQRDLLLRLCFDARSRFVSRRARNGA